MTDLRRRARRCGAALLLVIACAAPAAAQPPLARARALYNQQKFDEAIAAAEEARRQPGNAEAAALVSGRARLERYRRTSDPVDLSAAREALRSIRPAQLAPRDRVDLLIGQGVALFLADEFGAAAEVFEVAWGRADGLPPDARDRLIDWWASAIDRQAQQHSAAERAPYYRRVLERVAAEARRDAASAPAAYWLAVASRGLGDLERAANATLAGWVRGRAAADQGVALRADLDRLMLQAIIPERARQVTGGRDAQQQALASLTADWEQFKAQWK